MNALDRALRADVQLRRRMSEVASRLYAWAPLEQKERLWREDPECQRLLQKSRAAWERVWGRA